MRKKDWTKFHTEYRLKNSLYNFVLKPGMFESSVAIFFLVGIPSYFVVGERFATILALIFSFLTYFILKNEDKKWKKELSEYLKDD